MFFPTVQLLPYPIIKMGEMGRQRLALEGPHLLRLLLPGARLSRGALGGRLKISSGIKFLSQGSSE